MDQDIKTEQSKHRLGCKSSLGEGDGGLITNKWPAKLKLMMELIGSLHNLDAGSKFNLQLFPGLKEGGGASSHPHDQGSGLGLGCHQSAGSWVPCQHYGRAYLL